VYSEALLSLFLDLRPLALIALRGLFSSVPWPLLQHARPLPDGQPYAVVGLLLSLVPLNHTLSKVAALGRWCW
jgi:hypothetical protein